MEDSQTTDLAELERDASGMAAIEPTPELLEQAYAAILDGEIPPEVGDPRITARMILERIKSGTLEESMNPAEKLPAWADLFMETPVAVYGFHLTPSTVEKKDDGSASSVYAVVSIAEMGTGEEHTVSCGGQNVLVQLIKAWEERAFPFVAVLTGTKTGQGFTTLWLKRNESI